MKKIFRIARVELSNQFYSPIAWLLLIIFIVQCGITFTDTLHNLLTTQQMSGLFPKSPDSNTTILLADKYRGMFPLILSKLFLYLPLLTMGLISREVSSGSIRLLYSSPVTTSQIVLGKFTAMVFYNLILTAILGIFAAIACIFIPNAETGIALTGLLSVFLLLCTYAAIGLFMSCLTSYQVVAALSTLAVFAFLQYIGTVWQGIDFVRDITYFLSLGSRSQDMLDGLITSRDILYFIIITTMFLLFSILRLKSDQEHKPLSLRIIRYAGVVLIALGIGYVTSRPGAIVYLDVTKQKTQTLANYTQEQLKSTGDETLQMTAYVNLLDMRHMHGAATRRNDFLRTWEKYTRFKPIDYKFYYYYDTSALTSQMFERTYKGKTLEDVAKDFARMNKVSLESFHKPEESRKLTQLKGEMGKMVLELKYKNKTSMLRMYDDRDVWPFESQFVASLKRLTAPNTIQKVGFLEGALQRVWNIGGDRNYALFSMYTGSRDALINNGFDIVGVGEGQEIPRDLSVLVVSDPKVAFSQEQLDILRRYIDNGGNLLVTTEPGKQDIINPLLEMVGMEAKSGTLVSQNKGEVPNLLPATLTTEAGNLSQGAAGIYHARRKVMLPGATALEYQHAAEKGFNVEPLLISQGDNQWLKMGTLVNDSAMVEFDDAAGDIKGPFTPVVALHRKAGTKEQRIVVSGDGDFLSNITLQAHKQSNSPFVSGLFKWFSEGVYPVELAYKVPKDDKVELTDKGLSGIKVAFVWILPVIVLVIGVILLIRRKRK